MESVDAAAESPDGLGKLEPHEFRTANQTHGNGIDDEQDATNRDASGDETTEGGDEDEEEDDDDEEDEEPRLKYAYLTKHIPSLYRGGDATSTFLAGGDKMIVGTHNGNIHILSLPTFKTLRVYTAHSATVTSASTSPFPPPLPGLRSTSANRSSEDEALLAAKSPNASARGKGKTRDSHQLVLPPTPSNSIYIATSSIDGNVCVYSLLDPKDVLLRNFGRPVQAVALSPEYKNDRTYLSGGRAGQLILTVGGRPGTTENSTTLSGAAATASGWLGSLGLGANSGKDTVLHSGEGAINTIKWSLSGKYVVWVNEEGIKIMRSHLHLDPTDTEYAWTRIRHIDRPNRPQWEEMAGVWRAHAEWVDEKSFDILEDNEPLLDSSQLDRPHVASISQETEKLVIGWGGTIWVINVYPDRVPPAASRVGDRKLGDAEVVTILRTDCIISGVAMYSRNLLLVLAYLEGEKDDSEKHSQSSRKQRAAEPELRLIDVETQEEVSADTLSVQRYQTLSSSDYHMSVVSPPRISPAVVQRGTLGVLGTGLLDATLYPARLFASNASIRSGGSNGEKGSERAASSFISNLTSGGSTIPKELQTVSATKGIKIFVHSPFDCIAAAPTDLSDHLLWLESHNKYEEAWNLVDQHPEASNPSSEGQNEVYARSQTSLVEFFADDSSSVTTVAQSKNTISEKEKRRIGELWLEQLVHEKQWERAGEVCAKVLNTTPRWEHWIWRFIEASKFDEITQYIPVDILPPLPSKVFVVILEYYVSHDKSRFKKLLDQWPPDLFEISSIISAIEEQLNEGYIEADSDDWRILVEKLAKLLLADGRYREALRCYIRLQDAEAALSLIREFRLAHAISDDILKFILIRVSKQQAERAPISELEEASAESIKILVREAYNGIVHPETVVSQLQTASGRLYLYFYLRSLWNGEDHPSRAEKPRLRARGRYSRDATEKLAADEGRTLVEPFADVALNLFADYDRQLLMDFLQTSTSYSFDEACKICEMRHYTSELIYLLSKTGQTKRALNLILSDLNDVSQAINFAKDQDDADLWEDLLNYSMDKPAFIHALLTEAGTSIDPIKLVKRIPSGLEIEGLRDGLTRLLRDHDVQSSISQGAAKVLESEVAVGMDNLRRGQRRGIKFDICTSEDVSSSVLENDKLKDVDDEKNADDGGVERPRDILNKSRHVAPGLCGGCLKAFHKNEKEILVGFACGHIFHLSHVREQAHSHGDEYASSDETSQESSTIQEDYETEDPSYYAASRTVGPKVNAARLIRDRIGDGCRICALGREVENASVPVGA
ncbi:putative vacuolar assembly protein [Talaromyces proteolyticus]|uniref:Vacuolar assembly protein n=1 Tax=Talaromyces proteolyticus TaxID=1131652 RepID=A0AAD4KJS7_9EURO|nr:putative vacuolar assembly protein [Talaromyces proteolyticus]KAH8692668.1 putative vacuolar assembly protein [Talaromyces proteolyticus]